ncbi:MAG TPA: nuclear transport factor 2 family protein [Vicinamibacterales bacterium]|nr:nuclear transport factor 2 family protein [Vicinamibacterales bacterium]
MSVVRADAPVEQPVSGADHVELARLVTEAAWRVDLGKADTLHELFVDDGELVMGQTVLRGRNAIEAWGHGLVDAQTYRCIRHVCGNMRFVHDGPDAARGITVLTVFMVAGNAPASTLPWTVGEDHDWFVRTDQGWRIRSRRWEQLFARPEP